MKKEIKPDYYDTFSCIAGACEITCCQEWKIAVDPDTCKKWQSCTLSSDFHKETGKENLIDFVTEKEGAQVIGLTEEHKCPFLNKEKLCKLVIELGDEALSKTCTLFPRQIHTFADRVEYSLVTCCPEVIDILNRTEKISYLTTRKISPTSQMEETESLQNVKVCNLPLQQGAEGLAVDIDFLAEIRNRMLQIIGNDALSSKLALKMCFYVLLDILEKAGQGNRNARRAAAKGKNNAKSNRKKSNQMQDMRGINYKCISLEVYKEEELKELADAIRGIHQDELDTFDECNELFLDLAENYRKEGLYATYLEPVAMLAEQFTKEYDAEEIRKKQEAFEEQFQQYEPLMRNYLAAEIFTDFLLPDSNLQSLIVAMQWIGMEYAAVRQAIFLRWMQEGETELTYANVRDYIVVVARMTGYDEADIVEYFENSFQNLIWEWGYFSLIIG